MAFMKSPLLADMISCSSYGHSSSTNTWASAPIMGNGSKDPCHHILFCARRNATRPPSYGHFFLWPVYKYNRLHSDPLERERTRIFFFLYSDTKVKSTETGKSKRRIDFWPFFTYKRELNGNQRLQVFSSIEPYLPNNKSIE